MSPEQTLSHMFTLFSWGLQCTRQTVTSSTKKRNSVNTLPHPSRLFPEQVQRFVMDRLFLPEPEYMAVAGPTEPWVLDLRERVEKALDAAIVPMRVREVQA